MFVRSVVQGCVAGIVFLGACSPPTPPATPTEGVPGAAHSAGSASSSPLPAGDPNTDDPNAHDRAQLDRAFVRPGQPQQRVMMKVDPAAIASSNVGPDALLNPPHDAAPPDENILKPVKVKPPPLLE